MWQTYTPDGRVLTLRRTDEGWLATCSSNRVEAADPAEAIKGAVGSGPRLDAWIEQLVAELENAPADG